jgi:hypothetical protein
VLEGAVVRFLGILREAAAGKLTLPDMVFDTLAAHPLAGAGVVGAGTKGAVLFFFSIHPILRVLYTATGKV